VRLVQNAGDLRADILFAIVRGQQDVDERPRIGIVGTFDVSNFGDRLLPMIARRELEARLGPIELVAFSYHPRTADAWGYDVTPLEHLPAFLPTLRLLIVGGGDLIRFDRLVAPGYFPASPAVHHPTGFWLGPILAAHEAGVPVAWNAPGVPHDIPRWARLLARIAVSVSRYVNVRDAGSQAVLASLDGIAEIEVVPDSAFNAHVLLHVRDLAPSAPYLLMQSAPACREWLKMIAARCDANPDRRAIEVRVTSIGPALSDYTIAPRGLPPHARFVPGLHPLPLLHAIAGASAVVGTSLHLTIAALSAGVPALRPATAGLRKYGLLDGVEGIRTLDATHRFDAGGLAAMAPGPGALVDIRRRLAAHWDRIAALAATPRTAAVRDWTRRLDDVWAQLPAAFEARPAQERALTAVRSVAGALRRLRYNGRHG
jgi:hypothetical protein